MHLCAETRAIVVKFPAFISFVLYKSNVNEFSPDIDVGEIIAFTRRNIGDVNNVVQICN